MISLNLHADFAVNLPRIIFKEDYKFMKCLSSICSEDEESQQELNCRIDLMFILLIGVKVHFNIS